MAAFIFANCTAGVFSVMATDLASSAGVILRSMFD